MTAPLRVDLIDLSHWNANPDLHVGKAHGLLGLYHKATEGAGGQSGTYGNDPLHNIRRAAAHKAAVGFGSYHFARPSESTGDVQARHFLHVALPKHGEYTPMLDLEDNAGMRTKQLTAWVGSWVEVVKAATGIPPIIYTRFNLADHFNCPLWVARYSNDNGLPRIPRPWKYYTLRQFSDGAYGVPKTFPGLVGDVDLDHVGSDHPAQLLEALRIPDPAKPKPAPAPTPAPAPVAKVAHHPIADEVLAAALAGEQATRKRFPHMHAVYEQIVKLAQPIATKKTSK